MEIVYSVLQGIKNLLKFPRTQMWLDYDTEADVLYLHFEKEPHTTHSDMRDDGIILDYNEDRLVGITTLEASQR
ncbi:DUF2283 domain-containing protein [Candidatus Entotheonella palauensis]|uniref:DUF2283 domain-containing protein n=1 Tax=Candidatus Entotheonella gemina TaxID=1429439 RepID=W4M1A6_9BACT|nr:DUF2283 domain-containing protein [Candidatus Entotheonella palauensis]ETX03452.1 MAG: hypothetical protein ETSY2_33470 [Candidatus Entotheonella gemina]